MNPQDISLTDGGAAPEEDNLPQKKPVSKARGLLSWVLTLAVSFVLALLIKEFVVVNATVVSGSMEKTIMTGDRIMCNRLSYLVGDPGRYDIIAFEFTEGGSEPVVFVKRIIGLPGETVEITDGKVYVDSEEQALRDDFVNGVPYGDYGPFTVPANCYFVLGDNRNNSYDSKGWPDPYLPRDAILGKAMFEYYPTPKWLN